MYPHLHTVTIKFSIKSKKTGLVQSHHGHVGLGLRISFYLLRFKVNS